MRTRYFFLLFFFAIFATYSKAKTKHYDHGTGESSFGLIAHVRETRQEADKCVSIIDIGDSEVEAYNFQQPASCIGFSNLSAGMSFKARFALICKGRFDNCDKKSVEHAGTGILIYLPPAGPGSAAVIQEYIIVGTHELPKGH